MSREQLIEARCNVDHQEENVTTHCDVDLKPNDAATQLQLVEGQGHAEIATLIQNKKQRSSYRWKKDTLLLTSPEKCRNVYVFEYRFR
jgi:tRNA(Arg) A34 adenosine deaminase TadA